MYMTLHRTAFDTYEAISPCNVRLDDDSMAEAIGMGSIIVGVEMRGKLNIFRIKNMFYVPKLQTNLLSVIKFLLNGFKV